MGNSLSARKEQTVAALYKDTEVAETYIQKRFSCSWSRLLHQKQVKEVNRVLASLQPDDVLELAPGPARVATELKGISRGLMLDQSEEMLAVAKRRLEAAGLTEIWEVQLGNAFELRRLQRQFDFLYTFRFIRHFQEDERGRLYKAISSCLRPKGLLMFDVVNEVTRSKIDAQQSKREGALNVYDATYTPKELYREIQDYGFSVVRLTPVLAHFALQSWISYRCSRYFGAISDVLVDLLETIPTSQPLEWIALCRKTN